MMEVKHFILAFIFCNLLFSESFADLDDFRDILDEHNIIIPSDQLYGSAERNHLVGDHFNISVALLVGVDEYDNYDDLTTTKRNVEKMREYLLNDERFDIIVELRNKDASIELIQELMIDVLPEFLGEDDRFLFYFSGHGIERQRENGTLVGMMVLSQSTERFSTMIDMDSLKRWDEFIPAQHVLFLLDACVSGLAGWQVQTSFSDQFIDDLADPGHHLISAGTGSESTIAADRWGGSLFTYSFLNGVRGAADTDTDEFSADGVVSLYELMRYLEISIVQQTEIVGYDSTLTPQLHSLRANDGQFFFSPESLQRASANNASTESTTVEALGVAPEAHLPEEGQALYNMVAALFIDAEALLLEEKYHESISVMLEAKERSADLCDFYSDAELFCYIYQEKFDEMIFSFQARIEIYEAMVAVGADSPDATGAFLHSNVSRTHRLLSELIVFFESL